MKYKIHPVLPFEEIGRRLEPDPMLSNFLSLSNSVYQLNLP